MFTNIILMIACMFATAFQTEKSVIFSRLTLIL